MLEKCEFVIDKGKVRYFLVHLTHLSEVFNCVSCDPLRAKLHKYDFSLAALRFVCGNLTNRKQIIKVNTNYNPQEEILFGVPKGHILG